MARNLIPVEPLPGLAVLDHQDLRFGPRFYDLASLLNDSLFPPPAVVDKLLSGLLTKDADRLSFHRAAAQRTLKAVGTFEVFSRRGFPRHQALIPPTLGRALLHLRRIPEARGVTDRLDELWGTVLEPPSV
jgi:aminoglycoside/choline kinase family phosphotransferase